MFKSLVVVLLIAVPAVAQTVVTDGDTLTIDNVTYRLWGIDAPEMQQLCGTYPAGKRQRARCSRLCKAARFLARKRVQTGTVAPSPSAQPPAAISGR